LTATATTTIELQQL